MTYSYWLARFNRKMSFHFCGVFPLICDRSALHNEKHPFTRQSNRAFRNQYTAALPHPPHTSLLSTSTTSQRRYVTVTCVIPKVVKDMGTFPYVIPNVVNDMETFSQVILKVVKDMGTFPHVIPRVVNDTEDFPKLFTML